MNISLLPVHALEILQHSLECRGYGCRIEQRSTTHTGCFVGRCDRANACHQAVWNPFDEGFWVPVRKLGHLPVHFSCWDLLPSIENGASQESATLRVSLADEGARVKQGLCQLSFIHRHVRGWTSSNEGCLALSDEMQPLEGDKVRTKLPNIWVILHPGESHAGCGIRHGLSDNVVHISKGYCLHLEALSADSEEGFVLDRQSHLGAFNQALQREHRVVGLYNDIRSCVLGGWAREDREVEDNLVGVLILKLAKDHGTQTWASSSSERMSDLEALEAVWAFGLSPELVQNILYDLTPLAVVALRPIVSSSILWAHEVIGFE